MRSIIWSVEFSRIVDQFGGSRVVDQALAPVIDGLMKSPYGFPKFESDWTSFRVAKVRPIPGVTPGLIVVFTIDDDKNVVLQWLDEDVPF